MKKKNIKHVGKKAAMSAFFFAAAMGLALGNAGYSMAQTDYGNGVITDPLNGGSGDGGGGGAGGYAGAAGGGAPGTAGLGGAGGLAGREGGSQNATTGTCGSATGGNGGGTPDGASANCTDGDGGVGGTAPGGNGENKGDLTTPAGPTYTNPNPLISGAVPIGNIHYTAGSGGSAGAGGRGGNGGTLGDGGAGGPGGHGGNGGNGTSGQGHSITLGTTADELTTVTGVLTLTAGSGGSGGGGGDDGTSPSGAGGWGGNGGHGGHGGHEELDIMSEVVVLKGNVTLTAGSGGVRGTNGNDAGMHNNQNYGYGGAGGNGGNVEVHARNVVLDKVSQVFRLASGSAGGGAGSNTGQGGDATFEVADDLTVNQNGIIFQFTKGSGAANSGTLDFDVKGSFIVEEGLTSHLAFTNANALSNNLYNDKVHLDTLDLKKGSTLDAYSWATANTMTVGSVGTGENSADRAGAYSIDNLIVRTNAAWRTNGTYKPTTDMGNIGSGVAGQRITFDMTDVKRRDHDGVQMLNMTEVPAATGVINLESFDAVLQHAAYRNDPAAANVSAFITSDYQLKRLNLGTIMLADKVVYDLTLGDVRHGSLTGAGWENKTVGADGHLTDQDKANWFATDAGLRRYFYDVYVTKIDGTPGELMANNFYTADGYKTFLQGYGSGIASLNQSFWTTTEPIIREAATVAPLDETVVTVKLGGSSVKTDTGSDADLDNFSASLALSKRMANDCGETTLGLFAEYGNGSYDTYANIYRLGKLFGDGDVNHFGGGLFLRHAFDSGLYLEGTLRGGQLDNDYSLRKDSRFNRPYDHDWSSSSTYYGAHLGLGYRYDFSERTLIDFYGKALWTHTGGDTVKTGIETFHADDVESIRTRLGARLNHESETGLVKGFVGLAWEHEFDGEAEGYVSGAGVPKDRISNAPDLGGSSAFFEAGLSLKPAEDSMYSVDLGLFGLAGDREGFGGTLGLKFDF